MKLQKLNFTTADAVLYKSWKKERVEKKAKDKKPPKRKNIWSRG